MKYVMMTTVVAAVLAGSVLGCDNKAKEEQKAAAQPANAADATAMAKNDKKMAADSSKTDTAMSNMKANAAATTQKVGDTMTNMGTAASGEAGKMSDTMHATTMPSMGH